MKKIYIVVLLIISTYHFATAQNIGINSTGATPDAAAMLDISSTSKGLLIPRVALTSTNAAGPVSSPTTSLMVYNTATAGTSPNNVIPGYYYWNGTAWVAFATSANGSAAWTLDGNAVAANRTFGTTTNYPLPFITNNTEKMRLFTSGGFAIGATALDGTNPEKLLVDAGTTTSFNVISGKGSINSYLQLNIQNKLAGTAASSDIVASSNLATESANFVDLGINSSANTSTGVLGGANTGYLYSTGSDFSIGNSTAGKPLKFFTGGTATSNEAMRIDGDGFVMIGTDTNDGEKLLIDGGTTTNTLISAIGEINSYVEVNVQNLSNGNLASSDIVATANNGSTDPEASSVYVDMGINSQSYSNGNNNILNGSNVAYVYANAKEFKIGNGATNYPLIFFTNTGAMGTNTANGTERMRIAANGNVGIGENNPSYLLHLGSNSAAKPGSNTWTISSDKRLKKDITPFEDGLKVLTKITPVKYKYNGLAKMPNDGTEYIGIIAQEIKEVAPYTIGTFTDSETNTEYFNYDSNAVTYILINAVKEQQTQIEALKKQLEEQNTRLTNLENKIK